MTRSRPVVAAPRVLTSERRRIELGDRIAAVFIAFGMELQWSPAFFVVGASALVLAIGFLLAGLVGLGLASVILPVGVMVLDRLAAARERHRAEHHLPAITLLISRAVRGGQPLEQALIEVSGELRKPPDWLLAVSTQLAGGRPLDDTLTGCDSMMAASSQLIRATLRLGSSLGGDVAVSLDLVGECLRSDLELDARRRVLLSQAQLSSAVLVLMPLVFAVGLSVLRGGWVYDGAVGVVLLCGGLSLDAIGVWWMRCLTARLRIDAGLPSIGTLLQVAVSAGLAPREALRAVVDVCSHPPFFIDSVDSLRQFTERLTLGADFDSVTFWFATTARSQTELLRLLDVLRRGEHDGAALGDHLSVVVRELRQSRAVGLDVAAQRLTIGLLAPLMLCILPAFVLLAVVPLLLDAFASLPS